MEVQKLTEEGEKRIEREYQAKRKGLEEFMRQTSKTLSIITRHAGFILSPISDRSFLRHIELIPLGDKSILGVLVTHAGLIREKIIQLKYDLDRHQLYKISKLLNEKLSGLLLSEVKEETNRNLINTSIYSRPQKIW
jgi:heat-inducible transcriptional repressor